MDKVTNMECRSCGHRGDDLFDFVRSPVKPGVRFCPKCGGSYCYILEQKAEASECGAIQAQESGA